MGILQLIGDQSGNGACLGPVEASWKGLVQEYVLGHASEALTGILRSVHGYAKWGTE